MNPTRVQAYRRVITAYLEMGGSPHAVADVVKSFHPREWRNPSLAELVEALASYDEVPDHPPVREAA